MPEITHRWGSTEWEKHSKCLVQQHHGLENIINVPDKHKGDYGIECFSLSGNVYQMYAAQSVHDVNKLYEKQRNKINTDINKFINNESSLVGLFGNTKIKRWILMVPENVSAALVSYANKKNDEVLKKNLPYVSKEFQILIKDENDFLSEKKQLVESGGLLYKHPELEISDGELNKFDDEEQEGINNIKTKIKDNYEIADEKYEEIKNFFIREYIYGNNVLSHLHGNFPELWTEVRNIKKMREESLLIEAIQSDTTLDEEIKKITEKYKSLNKLHTDTIEHLAREAISDWLMRCPLNFKKQ